MHYTVMHFRDFGVRAFAGAARPASGVCGRVFGTGAGYWTTIHELKCMGAPRGPISHALQPPFRAGGCNASAPGVMHGVGAVFHHEIRNLVHIFRSNLKVDD